MAWINSLRKRDDGLLYQERAIFYHNPIPGWLRLLVGLVGGGNSSASARVFSISLAANRLVKSSCFVVSRYSYLVFVPVTYRDYDILPLVCCLSHVDRVAD